MCCTGEGEREPGAASPEAHARFRSWRGRHPTGAIALTWAPSRRWPRGQVGGTSAALSLPIAGPVLSCTASASFHCAIGTTWPFRSLGMAVPGTASSALPESHAPLSPFSRQTAPGTRGQDQLSLSLGLARHPWEDNLGPGCPCWGFWAPVGCLAAASRSHPPGQIPKRSRTGRASPPFKEDVPSHRSSAMRPAQGAGGNWFLCLTSFQVFFPNCFQSFSEESPPFVFSEWAMLASPGITTPMPLVPLPN